MKKEVILVVDYGTSNVRVNAIDTDNGDILHSASKKYLVKSIKSGYAEISVDHLWDFSQECMGRVMEQMAEYEEPAAIAFSFFGDNLIPVDRKGNALNDCILCTDSRGAEEAEYICSMIPEEEQKKTIGDTYMPYKFGAKLLWYKNHVEEADKKAVAYDTQQQYIFRKLGLSPVNDYTMAARKQLCTLENQTWSKRFLDVLGISEEALGTEIIATGEIAGYVNTYGDVRFKKVLPVIAGGHDCDVGLIGMGVIDESYSILGDITGTFDHVGYLSAGIVNLSIERPESPLRSYNGPLPNTSVCLGAIPTAGATLEWFMREINEDTSQEAYRKYWDSVQFEGGGTVMVHPTLDGDRGKIEGIGVTTTKRDMFQAVIEALTFENRRLIEDCESCRKTKVESVRIGGGAANSDEWMQLRADVSGKRIERMKNIQISSLGAAVLAAVRIGKYQSLDEAVEHMVHVADVFIPDLEVHEKYEKKYKGFMEKMGYTKEEKSYEI